MSKRDFKGANLIATDAFQPSPTDRVKQYPLPRNGREAAEFFKKTLRIDDLNDRSHGGYVSKTQREKSDIYQRLMDGRVDTPNGGVLYQAERDKNDAYMKYNDMPSYNDVINQILPQLTPQNMKQIKPMALTSIIDGKTERSQMYVYEVQVKNNLGNSIRTYVKLYPFHSANGKPYTILVSLHRTGPIHETATPAQKG